MQRSDGPDATDAPVTDGRRLRWAEHRTQRRAGFVRAGVAAIDAHGPAASAEQIAAEAGISRSVLYRYFRDKDDLHKAIADDIVTQVIDSVLPHLTITPDATPRSLISSAIGVIIGWLDEHPNLYLFLRERRSGSLDTVETTLADRIAGLLKMMMMFFGLDGEQAEPGAYGIVGFVESSGAWWLSKRTMSRERFTATVCDAVWRLLEGTARANGIAIDYDEPLPAAIFAAQTAALAAQRGDAMIEDDGYTGPAELVAGADVVPVQVELTGHFEPITGRYRWYGRVAASPQVAALVASGARTVELRTPHASVETTLSDVDPWGRPRVEGFGSAPFEVLDRLPEQAQ